MSYDNTADDVAKYFNVTPRVITEWATDGYPLRRAGEIKKIKLEGAQRVGAKLWRFNLKAVVNFIENLGDEEWVSRNVDIQRKAVKRNPSTGPMSSSSTGIDSKTRLMALLNSQKATNCQKARL